MEMDLIRTVLDGQAGVSDCKEALSEALRGIMVKALVDQMKEEVAALCGPHSGHESAARHQIPKTTARHARC